MDSIRGLLLEPFGRPRPRGVSAGPSWPDGMQQRGCVRYSGTKGSSDDVEAADAGRMAIAAILTLSWRGSGSIFGSTLMGHSTSSSSTTNSTESGSDSRTSLLTLFLTGSEIK